MTDFENIYSTYFHDVFLYIRRLSGDTHMAEEVTSETFLKAMSSVGKFRGECDIRVWLCQIAKNCYYDQLKKAGRTVAVEEAVLVQVPDPAGSPEEMLLRQEHTERLRQILHDIPESYKEVFMWRVFAELSFQQIGQIFGKTENWACVTYHRARNKIRSRMEDGKYAE